MHASPRKLLAAAVILVLGVAGCGGSGGGGAEEKRVTWSYSAAVPQVEKIPIAQALDKLKAQGYATQERFHQSGEDAIQAVARGQSDFGVANASAVFAATRQQVPIKAVMAAYLPGYVLVAPKAIADPGGLSGKRVGIHAKVSATSLYTSLALRDRPDVKPRTLVVPGSANRIRALAENQLDASMIQLSELPELEKLAPGRFHVIYNVAQKHPEVLDSLVFVNARTLAKKDYVRAVLRAALEANKAAYADPRALGAAIAKKIPKSDPATGAEMAGTYARNKIWPADGAFDDRRINATLEALKQGKLLDQVPSLQESCDQAPLRAALGG